MLFRSHDMDAARFRLGPTMVHYKRTHAASRSRSHSVRNCRRSQKLNSNGPNGLRKKRPPKTPATSRPPVMRGQWSNARRGCAAGSRNCRREIRTRSKSCSGVSAAPCGCSDRENGVKKQWAPCSWKLPHSYETAINQPSGDGGALEVWACRNLDFDESVIVAGLPDIAYFETAAGGAAGVSAGASTAAVNHARLPDVRTGTAGAAPR